MPMILGRRDNDDRAVAVSQDVLACAAQKRRHTLAGTMGSDHDESGVDVIGGAENSFDRTPLNTAPLPHQVRAIGQRCTPLTDHDRVHLLLPRLNARTPVTERAHQAVGVNDHEFDAERDSQVGSKEQAAPRFGGAVDANQDCTVGNGAVFAACFGGRLVCWHLNIFAVLRR